jgi:5-methylcytosine-specific restriction endonuclease McrA
VLRLALPEGTYAKLRQAQALLAHAVPGGELAEVVDRALDVLIAQLERRKFAATRRPRRAQATSPARAPKRPRTIPANVKRAVWQRDEGRCAFVSSQGRRCSARARLEFDHVEPVARGGTAHAEGMRLLCRAHNQFEAERVFGRAFMQRKRELAQAARSTRPGTSCGALDRPIHGQHPPAAPDPAW